MKITIEGSPEECKAILEKLGREVTVYREYPAYAWWEVKPIWTGSPIYTTTAGTSAKISITE